MTVTDNKGTEIEIICHKCHSSKLIKYGKDSKGTFGRQVYKCNNCETTMKCPEIVLPDTKPRKGFDL
jgi:hypothetical protein